MKVEVYDYQFEVAVNPLYALNEDYSVKIVLFELSQEGYRQHTMESSNQHYSTKNFSTQPRYEGTAKELSAKEVAIELLQRKYSSYHKKGYTEDLVALELERIKKVKGKLTDRNNYLKKLRKESLTKVPKKFVWYAYEETTSPIKVLLND